MRLLTSEWTRPVPARLASAYRAALSDRESKEETEMIMARNPETPVRPTRRAEPYAMPYDVHLYDRKGQFIKGNMVGDDYLKVTDSNVVFRGAVLEKQPFLSWRVATKIRSGETVLTPRELLRMSKMFEEGWDEDEETEGEDADSGIEYEDVRFEDDPFERLDDPGLHRPRPAAA